MWPNPQFIVDLVTLMKKFFIKNLVHCCEKHYFIVVMLAPFWNKYELPHGYCPVHLFIVDETVSLTRCLCCILRLCLTWNNSGALQQGTSFLAKLSQYYLSELMTLSLKVNLNLIMQIWKSLHMFVFI